MQKGILLKVLLLQNITLVFGLLSPKMFRRLMIVTVNKCAVLVIRTTKVLRLAIKS